MKEIMSKNTRLHSKEHTNSNKKYEKKKRREEVRRRGREGNSKQRGQVKIEGERRKDGNMHAQYSHMYMNINLYAYKI